VREHRLYEVDWLVRRYGFRIDEIFEADEQLDLAIDPKLAWALRHRELFPVDVNTASREMLLRVPGLGTKTVRLLLSARRHRAIRMDDLQRMRVPLKRAAAFIVTADSHAAAARSLDDPSLKTKLEKPEQLGLFDARVNARTGEL
jgi:predicted DNA-binding helix-hairpin-helix protein